MIVHSKWILNLSDTRNKVATRKRMWFVQLLP